MGKISSSSPRVSVPREYRFMAHLLCVQKPPCPLPTSLPQSRASRDPGYFLHSCPLLGEGLLTSLLGCGEGTGADGFASGHQEGQRKEVSAGGSEASVGLESL